MSKRKKHTKKARKHSKLVVNNTTQAKASSGDTSISSKPDTVPAVQKAEVPKKLEAYSDNPIMADVKYSLFLTGLIFAIFIVLFLVMRNESVAKSFYGIIKINI